MKRLYYRFSGTQPALLITRDLHALGVQSDQLHFLNKDATALKQLKVHRVNLFQARDISHSGFYGAFSGAAIGMVFCSYLMLSSLAGQLTFLAIAFILGAFTLFGSWVGGIIGLSKANHHIAHFHDAIEQGDTLLMLDAFTPEEEIKIKTLMNSKHHEASFEGEDPQHTLYL